MTAVGWVGLGKLGGPCAAALAEFGGHDVLGYDVVMASDFGGLRTVPQAVTVDDVVKHTESVVYVAVQTPHEPRYGGEHILGDDFEPADFEYHYLSNAVAEVAAAAYAVGKPITLVIVSTVLPGTVSRRIRPLLNEFTSVVYHPFFIAMGTVVDDFIRPEFVLLGVDDPDDALDVLNLYEGIHTSPASVISIESAELTKVAYNTFITSKIVFANTLAEMCEHTGADVDQVTDTLALATDRIISPKYMTAGMGDGGACHPRDNVALAALARQFDMSVDYMGYLAHAREAHTAWLAEITVHWMVMARLPLVILGKTYKPGVDSTAGSPALLLADILAKNHSVPLRHVDHMTDSEVWSLTDDAFYTGNAFIFDGKPRVFFIATRHDVYARLDYPAGSVVIDPFGFVPRRSGLTLVTPGRKRMLAPGRQDS